MRERKDPGLPCPRMESKEWAGTQELSHHALTHPKYVFIRTKLIFFFHSQGKAKGLSFLCVAFNSWFSMVIITCDGGGSLVHTQWYVHVVSCPFGGVVRK